MSHKDTRANIFLFIYAFSELLLLAAVLEEKESGVSLTILVVSEGKGSLSVHGGTGKNLHLIEFTHDELDHFGGALLETIDSIGVLLSEMSNSLLHEGLEHTHAVLLGKSELVKLMSIDNINDGLTFSTIVLIIG